MKKQFFVVAAVIISSQLSTFVNAQTVADSTTNFLQEVVVTANKFSKNQNETGKVISVINSDQISKIGRAHV